jgi:hypothetical protein
MQLMPPPRPVSPLLTAQMLLGGALAQSGWALLCFGSIFFWAFAWHADLTDWRIPAARFTQTAGEVLRCEKTKFSVGGSEGRAGTPVYRNLYKYSVNDHLFESTSYATGVCADTGPASIEYLPEEPEISRIAGMRRDIFGPWVLVVAVIPAIGLIFITTGIVRGRMRLRLLSAGVPVSGKLVQKEPTATRINDRTVYKITFQYIAHDGVVRQTVARTHQPERLEDEPHECVLYDPDGPARAMLLDTMPGKIAIDEGGQMQARSRKFLILPLLAIAGNLWWISLR